MSLTHTHTRTTTNRQMKMCRDDDDDGGDGERNECNEEGDESLLSLFLIIFGQIFHLTTKIFASSEFYFVSVVAALPLADEER